MKDKVSILLVVIAFVAGYLIASNQYVDPNRILVYGDSGLPKNCRAIIKESIDYYERREYSAGDILQSIDRNCGEFGRSRGESSNNK